MLAESLDSDLDAVEAGSKYPTSRWPQKASSCVESHCCSGTTAAEAIQFNPHRRRIIAMSQVTDEVVDLEAFHRESCRCF